jgi:hypothetical protein
MKNLGLDLHKIMNDIPNGIVLMFPNYKTMKIAFKLWNHKFKKWKCFKESKNKAESKNTIDEYF